MTIRTREQLIAAIEDGLKPEFLFFWGHTAPADGRIGKHVFSQWFPIEFTVDGDVYRTAEHWMMAEKARLFDDDDIRSKILKSATPKAAKALGRKVSGFDDVVWKEHRFDIVVAGNIAKFGQHPELKHYLLATGDSILVEAAPRDRIWCIGMSAGNEKASDPKQWRGLNLLGFALAVVRGQLD